VNTERMINGFLDDLSIKRKLLYDSVCVAEAAFRYFRDAGFPYPDLPVHVCMQQINKLRLMEGRSLLKTTCAYRVADTYHRHRYHGHVIGMKSPIEAYESDVDLQKAIRLHLKYQELGKEIPTKLYIVNGTQCCYNFRPGYALYIYRKYGIDYGTVLDVSTGYGGRLVGFIASDMGCYIGFDPSIETHKGNERLAADLAHGKSVVLYNQPIEDANAKEFSETVDLAFTSPPYFCKEQYCDEETQSWIRYKTTGEWCNRFLVPMMRFQHNALRSGCLSIVNIADVKIRNKRYPLVKWVIKAAEKVGFCLESEGKFFLSKRMGVGGEVATESVLVFRK